MSANGKVDYVFNDNLVTHGEVSKNPFKSFICTNSDFNVTSKLNRCRFIVLQKYKMNFDKNTGVIEMVMESLTPADEGTFTFQLKDGKATNQSSLVLIGDGMLSLINSQKV